MRLRPDCKNGGSRPFLNWDIEIPRSIYAIINISILSPWNYKVLSDIFVKIELFTYSYSVTTYLHYVMCFFKLCSLWGFLLKKKKGSIYKVELCLMQIEHYRAKLISTLNAQKRTNQNQLYMTGRWLFPWRQEETP